MRFALLLIAMLLPSTGWAAASWSKGCTFTSGSTTVVGTGQGSNKTINRGDIGCYRYDNSAGTHYSSVLASVVVHVIAESALITFDPALDAETLVATTALVVPYMCPQNEILTAANPQFSCVPLGGALAGSTALDGVGGPADVQNASMRVGPGFYVFRVTGACLAGDVCQVAVKGEGPGD